MSAVPPGTTLLLGGARSGKSSLAVSLGCAHDAAVVFVATARVDTGDADLDARVARHRLERPASWRTVETTDVVQALHDAPSEAMVIVDCITLWVADAFAGVARADVAGRTADGDAVESVVVDAARELATLAAARPGPTVLVSNEVGLGVHPTTELGRRYRDALGRVNVVLAERADRTLFLVAGRAMALHDPWTFLR